MSQTEKTLRTLRYSPLMGASIYLLFGIAWISFSDSALSAFITDPVLLTRYQTYKGLVYVAITALIAWLLLKQRAQIAHSLTHSQWLLNMTFEHAATGMAHVASDGRFRRVNKELCRILGYTAHELLDMTFQQLTHPMDLSKDEALLRKTLRG